MVDTTPVPPSPVHIDAPENLDAETFPPLQRSLALALAPDDAQVVLDLSQTRYASPGALLMLQRLAAETSARGRGLTLSRTPPTIRAALEALGLGVPSDAPRGAALQGKRTPG